MGIAIPCFNDILKNMKYFQEVCEIFPQRMHRKNKKEFMEFLLNASKKNGFDAKVDNGLFAKA